jgi:hypothetical protein
MMLIHVSVLMIGTGKYRSASLSRIVRSGMNRSIAGTFSSERARVTGVPDT